METVSWVTRSLVIFFGAGLGGVMRYWLGGIVQGWSGVTFPWGTVFVNFSGSFLLGLILTLMVPLQVPVSVSLFLTVGVLGGYTTFSALSYETWALLEQGSVVGALVNSFGSCLGGVILAWVGVICGRLIVGG